MAFPKDEFRSHLTLSEAELFDGSTGYRSIKPIHTPTLLQQRGISPAPINVEAWIDRLADHLGARPGWRETEVTS